MRYSRFLGGSLVALAASHAATAQVTKTPIPATPAAVTGDEIVVTATKRAETLDKVPISVAVTSAKLIHEAHITDLIDLQSVVPSLKVQQFTSVGQTNFTIRGFGNGAGNDGIETAVGVFIDGVYRSRAGTALDDLPEVDRIEVLRGPQSTLFGKNVSAGAINIITARPEFEYGGKAEISFGNYGLVESRATVTAPISSTIAVRLSEGTDNRDGTYRNNATGTRINDRNRYSLRADILWKPTDKISVRILGDYNKINEVCCAVVAIQNGPATQFIGAARPYGLGKPISIPGPDNRNVELNTNPVNRLNDEGVSGQIDWDFGPAKLTSITAYRHSADQSNTDVDFTGADIASSDRRNRYNTFTQEFRLASDGTGRFNYLLGAFYDHETLYSGVDTTYGSDIRAYADALSSASSVSGLSNLGLLEYLQGQVTPSIVPGKTYFQTGQGIHDFYTQHQTSYSIFGQADYKITNRLTVTGGLAFLDDHKQVASDVVLNDPFSSLNLQNVPQLATLASLGFPIAANSFGPLGALQFFYGNDPNHGPVNYPNANESGKLNGNKVTYAAHVDYDFGIAHGYLTYSTGWKAGAFNLSSDSRPPDANGVGRSVNPENVTLYEAGLKSRFRGGYLNLAIFHQVVKGFQDNAYTGTGYALVNAGEESVTGFEVETAYRPISWLSLDGAVTYLDPKYNSFKMAPCVSFDTVRCPIDPATGLTPNFRDLSGTRPADIPTWTASASASVTHRFTADLTSSLRGEFDYTSKAQLSETTPAGISTFGNQQVNASFSIVSKRYRTEVMLWARNLTNYYTLITTFPSVAQTGSYSGVLNEPRSFGATIRKSF